MYNGNHLHKEPHLGSGLAAKDEHDLGQSWQHALTAGDRGRDGMSLALIRLGSGVCAIVTFLLILLTTTSSNISYYTLHPPLQSLAILLFSWGIAPLQPPSPNPTERNSRFQTHQNLLLIGQAALMAGTGAIVLNKYVRGAHHFQSWHGLLGILVTMAVMGQGAVGMASTWDKGRLVGGEVQGKKLYKYHRLGGYAVMTVLLLTTHIGGIWSGWAIRQEGYGKLVLRILAYWIALPAVWVGLLMRLRPNKIRVL